RPDVPEIHGPVITPRGQRLTIPAERHGLDPVALNLECEPDPPLRHVPQFQFARFAPRLPTGHETILTVLALDHLPILKRTHPAPGRQDVTVRAEGQGTHLTGKSLEGDPQSTGGHFPQPDLAGCVLRPARASSQGLTVRAERHTPDLTGMSLEGLPP